MVRSLFPQTENPHLKRLVSMPDDSCELYGGNISPVNNIVQWIDSGSVRTNCSRCDAIEFPSPCTVIISGVVGRRL